MPCHAYIIGTTATLALYSLFHGLERCRSPLKNHWEDLVIFSRNISDLGSYCVAAHLCLNLLQELWMKWQPGQAFMSNTLLPKLFRLNNPAHCHWSRPVTVFHGNFYKNFLTSDQGIFNFKNLNEKPYQKMFVNPTVDIWTVSKLNFLIWALVHPGSRGFVFLISSKG